MCIRDRNNLKTRLVPQYRWFVFIVALSYWLYLFTTTSFDAFGWQFRFLTVWGLTFNLLVAGLMLRITLGYNQKKKVGLMGLSDCGIEHGRSFSVLETLLRRSNEYLP